jgi:hypothetical protein
VDQKGFQFDDSRVSVFDLFTEISEAELDVPPAAQIHNAKFT